MVVKQLNRDYEAKDPWMNKYVSQVVSLMKKFNDAHIEQIGRESIAHADALAGLASACTASKSRTIYLGEIEKPSFEPREEGIMES